MKRWMAIGLASASAAGAWAQVATPPKVATGATTAQQDYNAAVALDDKGDKAGALAAWQRFGERPGLTARTRGIAKVREGADLIALRRLDEGAQATRLGLANLPKAEAALAPDRWRANYNLGLAAENSLDYAMAASQYAAAEKEIGDGVEGVVALVGEVRTLTFVDPAAARDALERLDRVVPAAKLGKSDLAQVARLHTLVALNTGDLRTARSSALEAVTKLGGITEQTSVEDARARSDAAIALLLNNAPDEARRYMAMTGAGRLGTSRFDPAAAMQAPDCGGEAELKPSDVAVVEFAVDDDGRPVSIRPIYAAGGPAAGLAFARSVRDWSWTPDQAKAIPPFFRAAARVEMRCSTAFARPSLRSQLDVAFEEWLAGKGAAVSPEPQQPSTAIAEQRAALAGAEARSATSLQTLAALYRLMSNPFYPDPTAPLAARGLAIARAQGAPPMVQLALDLPLREGEKLDSWKPPVFQRLATAMLAEPAYAADPQARSILRLMMADRIDSGKSRGGASDTAALVLRQVADDKALAANDPLRVGALVRLASIEERTGNAAGARDAFMKTGLSPSQCGLLDAPPKMVAKPGSEAFPMEALQWGFEGWTQVQYDVGSNGRAGNVRALLSYPPFIFTKAGTKFFDDATFAKTYRPDGSLGCGASTTRVKFTLPK